MANEQYPTEVQAWMDLIGQQPGVAAVSVRPVPLDVLAVDELTSPDELFADMPRAALWRTQGGLPNEVLVQTVIQIEASAPALQSMSNLADWVEALSRESYAIQLRFASSPNQGGQFLLELFLRTDPDDPARVIAALEELTESLSARLQ